MHAITAGVYKPATFKTLYSRFPIRMCHFLTGAETTTASDQGNTKYGMHIHVSVNVFWTPTEFQKCNGGTATL